MPLGCKASGVALVDDPQFLFFVQAAFSVGYGPIAWVLSSEIFPLKVRGMAVGVATFVKYVLFVLVSSVTTWPWTDQ